MLYLAARCSLQDCPPFLTPNEEADVGQLSPGMSQRFRDSSASQWKKHVKIETVLKWNKAKIALKGLEREHLPPPRLLNLKVDRSRQQ
jgi:hypothetical protein